MYLLVPPHCFFHFLFSLIIYFVPVSKDVPIHLFANLSTFSLYFSLVPLFSWLVTWWFSCVLWYSSSSYNFPILLFWVLLFSDLCFSLSLYSTIFSCPSVIFTFHTVSPSSSSCSRTLIFPPIFRFHSRPSSIAANYSTMIFVTLTTKRRKSRRGVI